MLKAMHHGQLPLNALRAFEAAARHLSFKRAAEELNVTPAAIGHQVKGLEESLGIQLFRRLNRGLVLSGAGQSCLEDLQEGFSRLARVVDTLQAQVHDQVLTITVAPSFAAKWLIPRLHRFRSRFPDISVRLDTDIAEVDLARSDIDLALRFGSGDHPGLRADKLMGDELFPVCSPRLTQGPNGIRTLDDLRKCTLLHIDGESRDTDWADWPTWLETANCEGIHGKAGPRFTQSIMAVQAAIEGQGVALAPASIVADDLVTGRLVKPFADMPGSPTSFAFYIVSRYDMAEVPKVAAFREWVADEANDDQSRTTKNSGTGSPSMT